jgi:two-component system nitrate/nitrite response regulator NarL
VGTVKRNVPIVVVEPRTLLREGVMALLHGSPYRIVFSGSSVSELLDIGAVPETPHLAVLGLSGGHQANVDAIRKLRELSPRCKIVAIGDNADLSELNESLKSGIDSVVFNVASAEALCKVFDLVLLGQRVIILDRCQLVESPHQVATQGNGHSVLIGHNGGHKEADASSGANGALTMNGKSNKFDAAVVHLSNRERQILACVARGDANKLIARSCSITEATVKAHLKAILRKISVRNRTQAALWAVVHHLDDTCEAAPPRTEDNVSPTALAGR